MAGDIRVQGRLRFPGYEQTAEAGTSNNQVLTYSNDKAEWKDVATVSFPGQAFHFVDYDFATGMLIERYPEDGEDFVINPLIEYQEGLIKNEFELRDDGFLVFIQNG